MLFLQLKTMGKSAPPASERVNTTFLLGIEYNIVSKLKEKKLLGSSEKFELNVETILRRPSMNCGLKSDLWGSFCRKSMLLIEF